MKRRVLIISTYYHPVIGGVEIHARQLVQHLHARGFSVEVVTKRTSLEHPATETVDEVVVHRIGPIGERRASGKWVILPTLFATLLRLGSRFDVLVCVDYRGIGIAAIAAAAVLRKPVIAQGEVAGVLAGAVDGSNSGVPPESDTTKILKAPARLIYKRADAVACIGRDLETEAIRAGVAKARVHYLPHGVDMERFRPAQPGERDDLRRQLGWPTDRSVVLFVGRLSVEKGVLDLLEAWRVAKRGTALLVLVGPDMTGHPWDAGMPGRTFVSAHHLTESVRFVGAATDPAPYYRAADLLVQPSHFEALGNTAIEAMASGLPVVSSGVGGLGDFCLDGINALLHLPRSPESLARAIETLLADTALRTRLGEAARRSAVEQFEINALMDRYASLVEAV
ncbi:MAG TPA: glycosyltransferase family 4 protein [Vicinamibacterales bacterium]|nr:glycosyltransferase family 4 protein [Vicinamibacterales bacterium]